MSLFQLVSEDFRQKSGMIDQQVCIKLGLTYRQRELVTLVAKGLTNKEIALALSLSEFTVKNHIHRIMKLVDVGSRHEAVDLIRAGGFLLDA
jgi:DNA-binding NarL/FixJ family response regulator